MAKQKNNGGGDKPKGASPELIEQKKEKFLENQEKLMHFTEKYGEDDKRTRELRTQTEQSLHDYNLSNHNIAKTQHEKQIKFYEDQGNYTKAREVQRSYNSYLNDPIVKELEFGKTKHVYEDDQNTEVPWYDDAVDLAAQLVNKSGLPYKDRKEIDVPDIDLSAQMKYFNLFNSTENEQLNEEEQIQQPSWRAHIRRRGASRVNIEPLSFDESNAIGDDLPEMTADEYYTDRQDRQQSKLPTEHQYEEFKDFYEYDSGIGLSDYIIPAGQAIAGMIGASEPLPDPTMSPEMRTIIDEDMARRNQGLSPDELDYRNRMAQRGYSSDVSNIRRLTGGSAGAALGALGGASNRLQDQYSETAAYDEAMRRQNRGFARQSAGQAENFERYAFGVDYQEAMMDVQAAGQLGQLGAQEMKDLNQFKRTYGDDSLYAQYMEDLINEKRKSQHYIEWSRKNAVNLLGGGENSESETNALTPEEEYRRMANISNEELTKLEQDNLSMIQEEKDEEDVPGISQEMRGIPGDALLESEPQMSLGNK